MKSRMPQLGEAVFSIIYLIFGYIAAIILLMNANGREHIALYGVLTLILAGGDSFHLIPRIINAFSEKFEKYEFFAGLGLLVSSITMTVFYLVLYRVLEIMYAPAPKAVVLILYGAAILRMILCLFPQNNWLKKEGNPTWGIIRNVPFVIVGLVMIGICIGVTRWDMAIAILLSFACYIPVVLFAKKNPKIGMLMIPKTIAYMWMIAMGLSML